MAKKKIQTTDDYVVHNKLPTAEGRESQLIDLAYDLVEKRLREGTATSQETTQFLRMGSRRERLEREMIEKKIRVLEEQAEAFAAQKRIEELYSDAIQAIRSYGSPASMGGNID